MKRTSAPTALGRLELLLADAQFLAAARAIALEHAGRRAPFAGPLRFMDREAWLKSDALAGRARLRHAALRLALRSPPPRAREALNLHWLDLHQFRVARPLAAGWLGRDLPSWQFLITEFVAASPLDRALRASELRERDALLAELARETARMHALGFVHRDLYWRNVLVTGGAGERRLVFIDAWRGGERLQWRTAAYDLACLFLEGPSFLAESEVRAWLALYARERAALGRPVHARRLWSAANAARRGLLARARAEPGRWRVPEPAVQDFDFAAAAR